LVAVAVLVAVHLQPSQVGQLLVALETHLQLLHLKVITVEAQQTQLAVAVEVEPQV
jgi:hypothetical protein